MIVLLSLAAVSAATTPAAAGPAKTPGRVLFLGNSYTAQSRREIVNVAKALGVKARLEFVTPGGCTLQRHAGTAKTVDRIKAGWDVVVLQEQSQIPSFPRGYLDQKMYPASRQLHALIRQAGARTVFFMTWGRRDGDKRNRKDDTFDKMQKRLTSGYAAIARELGAAIAPVGPGWARLPADKRAALFAKDGSHPSARGAYLNACVFAIVVFHKNPLGMKYAARLAPADARFLQQTAVDAVKEWRTTEQALRKATKKAG